MTRQQAESGSASIQELGCSIGDSLGQGIAEGLQGALAQISEELAPLVEDILELLRREVLAARADGNLVAFDAFEGGADTAFDLPRTVVATEADERLAAIARAESLHPCEEEGCGDPAVARGLCRRHYARRLYQERKERLGAHGYRVVQPPAYGGTPVAEKKPASPVGPIIRRKRSDDTPVPVEPMAAAPPPAPSAPVELAPSPIAAAAAANGVTVESVARFLLGKG